jgi:hypothetical protein
MSKGRELSDYLDDIITAITGIEAIARRTEIRYHGVILKSGKFIDPSGYFLQLSVG